VTLSDFYLLSEVLWSEALVRAAKIRLFDIIIWIYTIQKYTQCQRSSQTVSGGHHGNVLWYHQITSVKSEKSEHLRTNCS
jgi:hypothetical protein